MKLENKLGCILRGHVVFRWSDVDAYRDSARAWALAMNAPRTTTCPPEILKWTYPTFLKEMRRRQTERELDELTTPFVPYYCAQKEEKKCL